MSHWDIKGQLLYNKPEVCLAEWSRQVITKGSFLFPQQETTVEYHIVLRQNQAALSVSVDQLSFFILFLLHMHIYADTVHHYIHVLYSAVLSSPHFSLW